jgi:hypothetical protein
LHRNPGDELVTIYIGGAFKNFVVHKLICESAEYSDQAFNGRFIEGRKGVMDLPEDHPGAFSLFI